MEVRDAVEEDADALAGLGTAPAAAWRDRIHDRTVRVATKRDGIRGVVAFDVRDGAVQVTALAGEGLDALLAEPVGFAATEDLPVVFVVPERDEAARDAAERAGFERIGSGPRFEGETTVRYRLAP